MSDISTNAKLFSYTISEKDTFKGGKFLQRGKRVDILSPKTSPRAQRERLTRFLDVGAILVQPALRLEPHRLVEVLRVVRDGPGAGVDFGLQNNINPRFFISVPSLYIKTECPSLRKPRSPKQDWVGGGGVGFWTYPFRNPVPINHRARAYPGKPLRPRRIHAQTLIYHSLQIWQLERRCGGDLGHGLVTIADLGLEFAVGFWSLEEVIGYGCKEGGGSLAAGDAVAMLVAMNEFGGRGGEVDLHECRRVSGHLFLGDFAALNVADDVG